MINFCTLFDSNYLSRGLAMHRSLVKHCPDFHLYIFSFDLISYDILKKLDLDHVTVVSLKEFENEDLLRVKILRSKGEYCWTCTSSTIYYCINKFKLSVCTYIDADLLFYSDPSVLNEEMGDDSILITEHRYTPQYDQSKTNGIYCVQFVTFKNDKRGMAALTWWKDRCIEWCYNRLEDGKFGDQKYLDDWTTRFEGVHVLKNIGGGVAPWNVQQYSITKENGTYWVAEKNTKKKPLVFFHFHWVRFVKNTKADLGYYDLKFPLVDEIYLDYVSGIVSIDRQLHKQFDFQLKQQQLPFLKMIKGYLTDIRRKVNGTYFVLDLNTRS